MAAKRNYAKQAAKLPSRSALAKLTKTAAQPGSMLDYAKATPLGAGALDAPSIDDWLRTPGTGLK